MHDQSLIQPDCVFNLLRARRASKNVPHPDPNHGRLHEQESLAAGVAVIVAVRCQISPTFQAFRTGSLVRARLCVSDWLIVNCRPPRKGIAEDGDYLIGFPEAELGLLPGAGGTQRLPRAIGASAALMHILMASRSIRARPKGRASCIKLSAARLSIAL